MVSKRFYVIRVCVPDFYFPFLPSIRKQFILESLCEKGFVSVYVVSDKCRKVKPILYYNYKSALEKCKYNNLNKKTIDIPDKYKTPQRISISIISNEKVTGESSEETQINYSELNNLYLEDFSINTESYNPNDTDPVDLNLEKNLLNDIVQSTFEHRKSIIADIESLIITSFLTKKENLKSKSNPS
ncbi:hypothetical protein LRR54_002531 [Salmonella enterica]|nr:hypothetical protein [Salmonella enterica]EIS4093668.1 hypothetical protein [Salmonella enterica]